jgi:hypothetical protein
MSKVKRLKFIVPARFRGAFVVIEDPDAPAVRQEGGISVYEIPPSGVLRTRSVGPLREWHAASAAFADSASLSVHSGSPVEPYTDSAVKLRYLYTDAAGRTYFLVGSESEQAYALKHRSDLRLGTVPDGA